MRAYSKSKLMALRQCPKRFWLEVNRPDLRVNSAESERNFQVGYKVGEIAQKIYDPENCGSTIDVQSEGFARAFERSSELLQSNQVIFEAGFSAGGALAFADVMIPKHKDGQLYWHMVEVKSSTSIKNYHRDDVAVQAYAAKISGVTLESIALAHIDSSWSYPGYMDYRGLLKECDLTAEALSRTEEVIKWISQAKEIAAETSEPVIETGNHCTSPYECGFHSYCSRNKPKPEYPIDWLPNFTAAKKQALADQGVVDMSGVPDTMLNDKQLRVKEHTLANSVYFDADGAAADLASFTLPAYFIDFETIQFAVPIWKGTRPYQQIPFQFSLHTIAATGQLSQTGFLDLSGDNPAEPFAHALIAACGSQGPVFVYNAGFETARISELAAQLPLLSESLLAINDRVVDLLPIARERYYHPSQQGSWSIKKVLPAVVPELRYDTLDGVQDGGMAMDAFLEGINAGTSLERKTQIEIQLKAYCELDTYAMVRLWQVFSGRDDLSLNARST